MLILERKTNESIIIQTPTGETIEIYLQDTTRGKAKIGVDAPDEYVILREELVEMDEE